MGTETVSKSCINSKKSLKSVKLNNPLMGTETHMGEDLPDELQAVKLNNPLMGTETLLPFYLLTFGPYT